MYNIYPKIKPATSTTLNVRIVRQKHKIIATLSMSFGESARSLQTVVFLKILKNLQWSAYDEIHLEKSYFLDPTFY